MTILKKVFFISLIFLMITLLIWGFYRLSFGGSPLENSPEKSSASENKKSTEKQSNSKIFSVSNEPATTPVLRNNDTVLNYYSKNSGKLFRVSPDGSNNEIASDKSLPGIKEVLWSPDKARSIIKTIGNNGETQFYLSDLDNNQTPLKKNLDNITWQASSTRIFYKFFDPKTSERTLNTADPDGQNWKKLTDLNYRDISIAQIPGSSSVSFWNQADSYTKTDLESMPIGGGEKKNIFSDKFGADYLWDNSGKWMLISSVNEKGGSRMQLGIANQNGGEYRNLDFATFASKCVWSNDNNTVFCALPEGIPGNAILPNDYSSGKISTTDTFWKVNVKTGEKTQIVDSKDMNQSFDAKDLLLSQNEKYLFFVNRTDSKIYRINL